MEIACKIEILPDKEIDGHFGPPPGYRSIRIAHCRPAARIRDTIGIFPISRMAESSSQRQVVGNHAPPASPAVSRPGTIRSASRAAAEGVDRLKKLIVRMHECTQNMGHFTEHVREVYMTVSIACIDLILFYGIIIIKQKEVYFKYII